MLSDQHIGVDGEVLRGVVIDLTQGVRAGQLKASIVEREWIRRRTRRAAKAEKKTIGPIRGRGLRIADSRFRIRKQRGLESAISSGGR